MIHEPLYKRAVNGAIRKWTISVEDNVITRISGQLHGTMTEKIDEIEDGKNIGRSNETSPDEQAESEALSYWKKQKDGGYKTFEELGINSEAGLEAALPKSNTDANGNLKPMLAQTVDWNKVVYPVIVQPKYDGVRCLMIIRDGEISFLSRSGKFYTTLDHIQADLPDDLEDIVLDGEIYSHDISFQAIISAVKKQGPNTLKLKFHAYDIILDAQQFVRIDMLDSMIKHISSPNILMSEWHIFRNKEEIIAYHATKVGEGFEGAMIRTFHGKYGLGARSKDLLKVKEFQDGEFVITGGKVNKVPLIGGFQTHDTSVIDSFTFTCTNGNGTFDAKPRGSRELRASYIKLLPSLIGQMLTVKYFGFTDDGLPRFPIGISVRDYE